MRRCISTSLCLSLWIGCHSPEQPQPVAPPPPPVVRPSNPAATPPQRVDTPAPEVPGATAEAPPQAPPAQDRPVAFPPPSYAAPFDRTQKPGDGQWTPLKTGADGSADMPPVLYKSIVHPHRFKGFVYVAVVAVDLSRADLHLVAGTGEPKTDAVPKERRPGLVPEAHRADLLAVFNGGFMVRHGGYGMMIGSDRFAPPRSDACAVALLPDGQVRIAPWQELQGMGLAAYRQTPECLIDKGDLHPDLDSEYRAKKWGGMQNGDRETRRSAVGLDATGRILLYGLGEWTTAKELAVGMKAAGSVVAAELDINWSYTRFLLFGRPSPGETIQVVETLVPKTEHSRMGYVEKASHKDFFYLKRRR